MEKAFTVENQRTGALAALLEALEPEKRELAGHAISFLVNQVGGEEKKDGVFRATDGDEHIRALRDLFYNLSREVAAALHARNESDHRLSHSRLTAWSCGPEGIGKRVISVLQQGGTLDDVHIRQNDFDEEDQKRFGTEKVFLRHAAKFADPAVDIDKLLSPEE